MSALIEGFEYDIFISYRQNDNIYDGWVTQFVENLQKELVATIKAEISVYFDENPHDGLLEMHQVDESLNKKLKCLIFIPIVSQTYCDPNCFAWQHEFLVFNKNASEDSIGMNVVLPNGNVSNRILPIKIHNLDEGDQALLEKELGGPLRSIDFIHQAPGVNRPLDAKRDDSYRSPNEVIYRDQINKVANSIKEILIGIKNITEPIELQPGRLNDSSSGIFGNKKESGQQLRKSIWRRNIPQVILVYAALSMILHRLLQSLIEYFNWPHWISTMGIIVLAGGSVVAVALAWIYEFGPEGLIKTSTWKSKLNPFPRNKKKPFTGIPTLITLVAVIVLQVFYFRYYPESRPNPERLKSIAVLPFDKHDLSRANVYISDGLTEEIIIQLSKVGSLRVISSESTKNYNSTDNNLERIGRELKAGVVLKSSIRSLGNAIRLNFQLVETSTSFLLWGESYDIGLESLADLGGKVAMDVTRELNINLSTSERTNVNKALTTSADAYDHYLRGRNYYNNYSAENNDSAAAEFKKAIALDADYAQAWAGLGDAYSQKNRLFGMKTYWVDSSIIASKRAVELDSASSEAFKSLGNAYFYNNQYSKALTCFKRAVELSPSNAAAAGNLGSIYFTQGDYYNSLIWQLRSAELNPGGFIAPMIAGWNYRLLGEYDKAETWLLKSISIRPYSDTYRELGYTYVLQARSDNVLTLFPEIFAINKSARTYEEAGLVALFGAYEDSAEVYFKQALIENPDLKSDQYTIVPLALSYFMKKDGNNEKVEQELNRLEDFYIDLILEGSEDDDHRLYLAGIKNMQGDEFGAMVWLQRAIAAGFCDLAMIERIPWLKSLTKNPDYPSTIEGVQTQLTEMARKVPSLED